MAVSLSSLLLPAGEYRAVREAFVRFADASIYTSLFHELIERSRALAELPDEDAVSDELVYLRDRATLGKVFVPKHGEAVCLQSGDIVREAVTPAEEVWRFASRLDLAARHALDVLLRRALNPLEALATWPLEALFTPEEVTAIREAPRSSEPVRLPHGSWASGRDIDYHGFVCAIVKFTRLCNLRCIYCHDWRAGPNQTMQFPVQLQLFQKLLQASEHVTIDVIWHGGESTLLGRRGFLRILALQRWFRRSGQQIRNRVQTNATTLDESWARFLACYKFQVGVSLDGPAVIHDSTRRNIRGHGTLEEVRRGMRILKNAGLQHHVYVVISEAHLALGADVLVSFLQEEGYTRVGMLPVRPTAGPQHPGEAYLGHEAYVRFLLDVERVRKARPQPWLQVRELDAALRATRGEMAGFCELLGNCVGTYFSIEPDGSVGHCDRYIGDPAYTLGSIVHQDFDAIRMSERVRKIGEESRRAAAQKETCPHFAYCRGWCPHEHYMAERYDPFYDGSCCGLAGLFDALKQEAHGGQC